MADHQHIANKLMFVMDADRKGGWHICELCQMEYKTDLLGRVTRERPSSRFGGYQEPQP